MKAPTEIALNFVDVLIENDVITGADQEEGVELDVVDIVQTSRAEGLVAGFAFAQKLSRYELGDDADSAKILEELGIAENVYKEALAARKLTLEGKTNG